MISVKKRIVSIVLLLAMFFSIVPVAYADKMTFADEDGAVDYDDVPSGQWGTVSADHVQGPNAKEDTRYSSFDEFRYVKYNGSCNNAVLKYVNGSSKRYPYLADGKYFYGIYTPGNDYDNYSAQFGAYLNADMLRMAKEGQLEICVTATTINKKGTFNSETGVVGYQLLDKNGKVLHDSRSPDGKTDGRKDVTTGWSKINEETDRIVILMYSKRHGLGTQWANRCAVYNVNVYFRDTKKPVVVETGIVDDSWNNVTNSAGKTFGLKSVGDTVTFYAKFNEPVKTSGTLKMGLKGRNGASYEATYLRTVSDTVYFTYKIEDHTQDYSVSTQDVSLNPWGIPCDIRVSKGNITDAAGNAVEKLPVPMAETLFQKTARFIDDTHALLAKEMGDENGAYPAKYLTKESFNLYGSLPAELKGKASSGRSGNQNIQPTLFKAGGDIGMIFRVAVNTELASASVSKNTRMKLRVYDGSGSFTGKYVYADLVAARLIGANKNYNTNYGVKNNMVTEMFFRYVPAAGVVSGELYRVAPYFVTTQETVAAYGSRKIPVTRSERDLVTTDGQLLKTLAGKDVDFSNPAYMVSVNKIPTITVDSVGPSLVGHNIPTTWTTKLSGDACLAFRDGGGFSYDGAQISVVYYEGSTAHKVRIKANGALAAHTLTVPCVASQTATSLGGEKGISLSGLTVTEQLSGKKQLYIEYTVTDLAGNVSTNVGQKNIPLFIDVTGPVVTGSTVRVDGLYGEATFDVRDDGIGGIADDIYYRVEHVGDPLDESSYNVTVDSTHTVGITGKDDSKDTWRIWANFSDILGNRTKSDGDNPQLIFTPSQDITMANRSFELALDVQSPRVSDSHSIFLKAVNIPDKEYTFDIYYKWVKGTVNDGKDNYQLLTGSNFSRLAEFPLANKDVIREFVDGYELSGEYTLFAYAVMKPDNAVQYNLTATVYFDSTAPEITASVELSDPDKPVSPFHYVRYSFDDDANRYKKGMYVKDRNILFREDGLNSIPVLYVYVDNIQVDRIPLTSVAGTVTVDVMSYLDSYYYDYYSADTIKYHIAVEDNFGLFSSWTSEELPLDNTAPVMSNIRVDCSKIIPVEENLFIVSSLSDIESLSVTATDNRAGGITVSHRNGGLMSASVDNTTATVREYTYEKPILADFTQTVRNGLRVYRFTFFAEDSIGNVSEQFVDFIWDSEAPTVEVIDDGSAEHLGFTERAIYFTYAVEPHEVLEDFTFTLTGPARLQTTYIAGELGVFAYDNGTVTLTVSDRIGHVSSASVTVDTFDHIPPAVQVGEMSQLPVSGAAKYGEIHFSATDEAGLDTLCAAIVPAGQIPQEDDIWYGMYDFNGHEHAQIYIDGIPYGKKADFTVYYSALPTGIYDLYVMPGDVHDNVSEPVKIATITTDATGAVAESVTYSPSTVTANDVIVTVTTDIPTTRMYESSAEGNVALMQDYILEMRRTGFYYVADGQPYTVRDMNEVNRMYEAIAAKYETAPDTLTELDRELYKNVDPSYYSADPYFGFLEPDYLSNLYTPIGDLLDFLHNEAFYAADPLTRRVDLTTPRQTPLFNIYDDPGYEALMNRAGLLNRGDAGTDLADTGIYTMNLMSYPAEIDLFACEGEFIPSLYEEFLMTDSAVYANPFFGSTLLSGEQIVNALGVGIDTSLFVKDEATGLFLSPFSADAATVTHDALVQAGLDIYADQFNMTEGRYRNPLGLNEELFSIDEMATLLKNIYNLKSSREKTAEMVAEKFVQAYLSYEAQEQKTVHYLRFGRNVDHNVKFMDITGQILEVPVKIDWIDPSAPSIPEEWLWLTYTDGNYFYSYDYTNEPALLFHAQVPDEGVYLEYYLVDLPAGAVGVPAPDDKQTVKDVTLYKSFSVPVTDNTPVLFSVMNPSVLNDPSKVAKAAQSYAVSCFDREGPTAELQFTPARPDTGFVNTDVFVELIELTDNCSSEYALWYDLYFFNPATGAWELLGNDMSSAQISQNGSYKYILRDGIDNITELPFTVDYIDKNPVTLTLSLFNGTTPVAVQTVSSDTFDYTNVSYEMAVADTRSFAKPFTVQVYANGTLVGKDTVRPGETEWSFQYTAPSGNKAALHITGFRFDTKSPTAIVEYLLHQPGGGQLSSTDAIIELIDENLSGVFVKSAIGRLADGTEITAADVELEYDGEICLAVIPFAENGFAEIVFSDASGNELLLQVNVDNLDRTIPRAFIEYSRTEPTSGSVQATIYLTEAADYEIYDINNVCIRPFAGVFSTRVVHTFEENASFVFRFRDRDGNTTEGLLASVSNIDKVKPVLGVAAIHKNMALDMNGNLIPFNGAATIELQVLSNDIFTGGAEDTVQLLNAAQSRFHTVMENGTYTFRYSDFAGNSDVLNVDVDVIDRIPPTALVAGNPTAWTNKAPEITVTAMGDGCCGAYIILNGKKHESVVFTPEQNDVYTFVVQDECGNSITEKIRVAFVDLLAPDFVIAGSRDLWVKPGEFDRTAFEQVECTDLGGSGIAEGSLTFDYGDFDANVPGEYDVVLTVRDNAGNVSTTVRTVTVLGEDEICAVINGVVLYPESQTTFWNGEDLVLTFLNAEQAGDKVSYAFEKGYFNGAQMKGTSCKALTTPDAAITLDVPSAGMYTLFVQTENRRAMVMYVFVATPSN